MSEPALLSLDDVPELAPEVALRVLAGALDPDAPPAPADLIPADPEPVQAQPDPAVDEDVATGADEALPGLAAADGFPDIGAYDEPPALGHDADPDDSDGPW